MGDTNQVATDKTASSRPGAGSADAAAPDVEPSMEDILASIREILAEEGEPETSEPAEEDKLDLTAPIQADPEPPATEPAPTAQDDIDALFDAPAEAPQPDPEPVLPDPAEQPADFQPVDALDFEQMAEAPPEPAGRPAAAVPDPPPAGADILELTPAMRIVPGSPVLSSPTATASTDVLAQLAKAILDRRDLAIGTSTTTLESMVREMLRPLLKEWLDRNLPYLIERLVKREIDQMINRAERLED